ncbi:AI-2E family transporter [Pseudooceanicola sp. CBS1P-1]|uniref:AI-2E family transporter n=1 Tax=Pseudooceanicola albus TaxID=2692189 RepID=A0A6L7G452_9RHOB|nr:MULTISPECIES: AI-2E family transporter [Pseudooceanicola]MBT9384586.1 AI-2E family transporter [Pseudooceanicola endophyticus]MXN18288.1 AI-2E family transporter [Pseudooceanicola albus]
MTLPVRKQLKYWGIAAAVFLLMMWWLGSVIMPFLLGMAIAYFLDPVADRLQRLGASRTLATAIITLGAVVIFVLLALMVVPAGLNQAIQLFDTAPQLFQNLQNFLSRHFPDLQNQDSVLRESLSAVGSTIQSKGGELLNTALSSVGSFINIMMLFVIVPVVAFYMLYDWDNMVAEIDSLLPRDHAPTIRQLARDIDNTLAGFIRGMGSVCLILGTYYAIALMLAGLQFGLVIGAFAGLITFIPYVGALLGGALAIGIALFQFWGDWLHIGIIAGIFALGQVTEGNFLTPKLVGGSVGLHPVWLIFALSVFGTLFGFVGMLAAVPLAAAIGVLARFMVRQYTGSSLYRGTTLKPDDLDQPN